MAVSTTASSRGNVLVTGMGSYPAAALRADTGGITSGPRRAGTKSSAAKGGEGAKTDPYEVEVLVTVVKREDGSPSGFRDMGAPVSVLGGDSSSIFGPHGAGTFAPDEGGASGDDSEEGLRTPFPFPEGWV